MFQFRALTAVGAIAVAGAASGAATLLVDFGTNSLTASPDTNGNSWNNITGPVTNDMVETGGTNTGIGIQFNSNFGPNNPGGLATPDAAFLGNLAISSATSDYFFTSGPDLVFTLNGLDVTKTYDIEIFATRDTGGTRITAYSVQGAGAALNQSLQTSGAGAGSNGSTGNDDDLAGFFGVSPTAGGEIQITASIEAGGFAYIGALRLTEVPAPGGALPLAVLGVVAGRRRR